MSHMVGGIHQAVDPGITRPVHAPAPRESNRIILTNENDAPKREQRFHDKNAPHKFPGYIVIKQRVLYLFAAAKA